MVPKLALPPGESRARKPRLRRAPAEATAEAAVSRAAAEQEAKVPVVKQGEVAGLPAAAVLEDRRPWLRGPTGSSSAWMVKNSRRTSVSSLIRLCQTL